MMILLLAAALTPAPAVAAVPATTPAPAEAASTEPKKICKKLVPTGSILPVKSCRTQQQWDKLTGSGSETLRQVKDASQATMGAPAN